MLQAMRQNMKVILWITVIGFILLIFLVWGADLQLSGGPQPNVAGLVNGDPVSRSAYQQLLANNRQNARARGFDLLPSDEMLLQEQTWETLVNEMLIRQEANRQGFEARDSEIRAILLNNPPAIITQDPNFQNATGQFDLAGYRAFLLSPQTPEIFRLQLESFVRDTLPSQKLQDAILSTAKVTEEELRQAYIETNEVCKITYVMINAVNTAVPSDVTDQEIADYFQANTARYALPRLVDLTYVTIPRMPTHADSQSIQADLLSFAEEARDAEEAKRTGAENLDDSDFETLVMTFSDLPDAGNGGLTPDFLGESSLSAGFRDALDGLAPGDISDPFEDGDFYHLVQLVESKIENDQQTFQFRDFGMRIDPSDSTIFASREKLDAVRAEAGQSGLRQAAENQGLTVAEASDVSRGGLVPGLISLPRIADFAHENKPGTLSRVMSTNTGWYLVEVSEVNPGGTPELSRVRSRVMGDLLTERRFSVARVQAERLEKRIRSGETLEQTAEAESLSVISTPEFTRADGVLGLGRDTEVLAHAFTLAPGDTSPLIKGRRGWLIIRVDERPPVNWDDFDIQSPLLFQTRLAAKQNRLYNALLDELRKKASIVDYRT